MLQQYKYRKKQEHNTDALVGIEHLLETCYKPPSPLLIIPTRIWSLEHWQWCCFCCWRGQWWGGWWYISNPQKGAFSIDIWHLCIKLKWTLCNKIKSVIRQNPSETHWTIQFEAIENSLCPFKSNYNPAEREKSCLSNDQRVAALKASISTRVTMHSQNHIYVCLFVFINYSSFFSTAKVLKKKQVFELWILRSAQFWPHCQCENAVIATLRLHLEPESCQVTFFATFGQN